MDFGLGGAFFTLVALFNVPVQHIGAKAIRALSLLFGAPIAIVVLLRRASVEVNDSYREIMTNLAVAVLIFAIYELFIASMFDSLAEAFEQQTGLKLARAEELTKFFARRRWAGVDLPADAFPPAKPISDEMREHAEYESRFLAPAAIIQEAPPPPQVCSQYAPHNPSRLMHLMRVHQTLESSC
jgi:hypothetical protein